MRIGERFRGFLKEKRSSKREKKELSEGAKRIKGKIGKVDPFELFTKEQRDDLSRLVYGGEKIEDLRGFLEKIENETEDEEKKEAIKSYIEGITGRQKEKEVKKQEAEEKKEEPREKESKGIVFRAPWRGEELGDDGSYEALKKLVKAAQEARKTKSKISEKAIDEFKDQLPRLSEQYQGTARIIAARMLEEFGQKSLESLVRNLESQFKKNKTEVQNRKEQSEEAKGIEGIRSITLKEYKDLPLAFRKGMELTIIKIMKGFPRSSGQIRRRKKSFLESLERHKRYFSVYEEENKEELLKIFSDVLKIPEFQGEGIEKIIEDLRRARDK